MHAEEINQKRLWSPRTHCMSFSHRAPCFKDSFRAVAHPAHIDGVGGENY